jgi:nicotinamide-nucleotide amidase
MAQALEEPVPDAVIERACRVLKLADAHDTMLATAESCTGGLLASLLTDISGLSHVFERGFVSYSNAAKCDLLDIDRDLVDRCGAVSRQVAEAMARGALKLSGAGIALSITGFAGPAGPDDEEGLVHFACACEDGRLDHRVEHYGAIGRGAVRHKALDTALAMIEHALES